MFARVQIGLFARNFGGHADAYARARRHIYAYAYVQLCGEVKGETLSRKTAYCLSHSKQQTKEKQPFIFSKATHQK
jgi:hypothetical protein